LGGGSPLEAALTAVRTANILWREVDPGELKNFVMPNGPAAAGALWVAARAIVEDAHVSEAVFLIGTEVSPGEAEPAGLADWRSIQRSLYGYAIKPWMHQDDALDFVQTYRDLLLQVARIAVPRHRFWKAGP